MALWGKESFSNMDLKKKKKISMIRLFHLYMYEALILHFLFLYDLGIWVE